MTEIEIRKMAEGHPPSTIGMDCEEVITWLAVRHVELNEQVQALAADGDDMNRDAELAMQLIERMEKQLIGYQAEIARRDSSVKGGNL